MQTQMENRAEIPEAYKWRMEDIYPDTAAWEADLAALLPMGEQIAAYAGQLGEEDALKRYTDMPGCCRISTTPLPRPNRCRKEPWRCCSASRK